MTAYKLGIEDPSKNIVILEQNNSTFEDYKNDGYEDVFKWYQAQNDSKYQYTVVSDDNKTIWRGKGAGGGTLHFGLQYIDTLKS